VASSVLRAAWEAMVKRSYLPCMFSSRALAPEG